MVRLVPAVLALVLIAGVAAHAQPARTFTVTGVVKTISASSLTVSGARHDVTFAMTRSTRYIGRGAGGSDLVLRDPRPTILDVVKRGDRVTVTYRVSRGALSAVQVRKR